MNDFPRLRKIALDALPKEKPDIVEWAQENVNLPGSARSTRFDCSIAPWLREPLQMATDDNTRIVSLIKPVQSGGSVFGEVLLLYWIMFSRGFRSEEHTS